MIICPFCKAELETEPGEYLEWCDICGEELLYCPTCKEPKKGSACPRCGDVLVKAGELDASAPAAPQPQMPQAPQQQFAPPQQTQHPVQPQMPQSNPAAGNDNIQNIIDDAFRNFNFGSGFNSAPQQGGGGVPKGGTMAGFAPKRQNVRTRLALVYQGNNIDVVEGCFGRNGGVYPFMAGFPYISGRHGEIKWFDNHKAWGIVDHGSTNGTFINGIQLTSGKWYLLEEGSSLSIADLEFQIIKL